MLVAKTIEDALRGVPLLAMLVLAIPPQPLVDESGKSVELRTAHRRRAPVKVLGWLRRKLDVSVESFMKTLGALVAGSLAAQFVGVPVWEHIGRVFHAALQWLDAAIPPF